MSYRFGRARASLLLSACFAVCVGSTLAQEATPQTSRSTDPAAQTMATPATQATDAQATELEMGASPALAESPDKRSAQAAAPVSATTPIESGPCCTLPDGMIVQLEIAEALNSKTAQRGQRFKLRLSAPLQTSEGTLVASGTEGEGEVIHAERARSGGKAGELILAARFLNGPAGEIKLRGMKLGGIGKDQRDSANALLMGTAIAAPLLAPVAMLVRGGNLDIPIGTPAHAKLAGAIRLPPVSATANANTEPVDAKHASATNDGAANDGDTNKNDTSEDNSSRDDSSKDDAGEDAPKTTSSAPF
jgi:hypothetical protein